MARMSKDERNARRKARYAELKAQGLTREQTRSLKKQAPSALKNTPKAPAPKKSGGKGGGKKSSGKKAPKDFASFAAARGNLSANQIIKEYRKAGGSIGNEKGKAIIRDVYKVPKQLEKKTRVKYLKPTDKTWTVGGKKIPKKTYHAKGSLNYVFSYRMEGDVSPRFATVINKERLTIEEAKDALLMMFDELSDEKNGYSADAVIEESIDLLYVVDNT